VFVVLVATAIGIGVGVMIHDAVTSRNVIIDPFDAPPALAASGLSGKVVAAGLLDVLTRIQAASRIYIGRRDLSNAWTNELSIEIPETGLSIGQLERTLKTRFGHDQHIDGDLVQTAKGGLALTVRGTGIQPKTFTNDSADLDKLLTRAGEYVYGQSQPVAWGGYLNDSDRYDETIRFVQAAFGTVAPSDRPRLLVLWGNAIVAKGGAGAMAEALPLYREAVRLKPDYWTGYGALMYALGGLGDEESIVRLGEQMIKLAGGRPGRAPEFSYQNYDLQVWNLPAVSASTLADMESHGGIGTNAGPTENLAMAQIDVLTHDDASAALRLKTTIVDENNPPDVAAAAVGRALLAEENRDLQMAAKEWDAYAPAYAIPGIAISNPQQICYAAVAYEKAGQSAKADAALKPFGNLTHVDCYRFRGDVLDLRGDWSGAKEWYAKAVKLGPSIPSGYYSWGVALAKRGDLAGATAQLELANQKGPHWADPLKAWGDVLVKQGKTKEALAKYDEALKCAPNWKELKGVRELLAKHED
jgi:tetratricopeptide (TPR) repeat protein